MSGLEASAQQLGADGDAGSKQAALDDPSQNDLSAPFFRMRFGRDLRLAEVRREPRLDVWWLDGCHNKCQQEPRSHMSA